MTDLQYRKQTQAMIRDAVRGLPASDVAHEIYTPEQLAVLPEGLLTSSYATGNPVAWASPRPGETVVDIGSGAGVDSILAALAVGVTGRVVGVDLTAEMCQAASGYAAEAGAVTARFVQGEAESLPLADDSADVVVSNSVVSVTVRKTRVLAEAYRVVRPGGRIALADMTLEAEDALPAEVLSHPSAWAG